MVDRLDICNTIIHDNCRFKVTYFLHVQCISVVRSGVGVLDILEDNLSLLRRLVDNLRNEMTTCDNLSRMT